MKLTSLYRRTLKNNNTQLPPTFFVDTDNLLKLRVRPRTQDLNEHILVSTEALHGLAQLAGVVLRWREEQGLHGRQEVAAQISFHVLN